MLLIAAIVVAYILGCMVAGYVGRYTRMGPYGTFYISLLITPLLMLLLLIMFAPSSRVEWRVRHKRQAARPPAPSR
jgi:uncharacterized membrane protein